MKRKLNKLSVAIAATLAVGAAGQAQATDLVFPYVVVGSTVTTLVNVLNPGDSRRLHYRLWYKNGANATNNAATCQEVDVFRATSLNDIQTIDLGAKVENKLGVVFNDPSFNNNWVAPNQSYALAANLTAPVRGWLHIDDQTSPIATDNETSGTAPLRGEAMVFEFQSGAAWGYQAGAAPSLAGTPGEFRVPAAGIAMVDLGNGLSLEPVSVFPWDDATTRYFVLPIDDNMRNGNNAVAGLPVVVNLTMGLTDDPARTAMWDRDENPVSGARVQQVRCVGAVNAEDMLSEGARLELPDGGWGFLQAQGGLIDALGQFFSTPIVGKSVIKLEFNEGGSPFAGLNAGVFNDAYMLRGLDVLPQP